MADPIQMLIVRDSAGSERIIPLDRDVITVGRDLTCTIRLDSLYVSRQHARIEVRETGAALIDLGSRNGSAVNGRRVEGVIELNAGDVVSIGDATIECLSESPADGATRTFIIERPESAAAPDVLRVEGQTHEVWVGPAQLERRLSAQEFELVRYLYDNRDRVCQRQELGDAIWGTGNWDPNMLHRLVHRLKEKLEPSPERTRYVQTVPWVGYRLTP